MFVIYPLVRTFYMSTCCIGLFGRGSESVGLQQLLDVATSASPPQHVAQPAAGDTDRPDRIALGVALAVLANTRVARHPRLPHAVRHAVATSVAVVSIMAVTIVDPQTGWLAFVLDELACPGPARRIFDVLNDPTWALPAVSAPSSGQPRRTFIIVLAALQSIPDDLLEVGAPRRRRSVGSVTGR